MTSLGIIILGIVHRDLINLKHRIILLIIEITSSLLDETLKIKQDQGEIRNEYLRHDRIAAHKIIVS